MPTHSRPGLCMPSMRAPTRRPRTRRVSKPPAFNNDPSVQVLAGSSGRVDAVGEPAKELGQQATSGMVGTDGGGGGALLRQAACLLLDVSIVVLGVVQHGTSFNWLRGA